MLASHLSINSEMRRSAGVMWAPGPVRTLCTGAVKNRGKTDRSSAEDGARRRLRRVERESMSTPGGIALPEKNEAQIECIEVCGQLSGQVIAAIECRGGGAALRGGRRCRRMHILSASSADVRHPPPSDQRAAVAYRRAPRVRRLAADIRQTGTGLMWAASVAQ
jgi:hypothetical protein